MAIIATLSNHYKAELLKGNIDLENDTVKIILMTSSFAFNKDNHATLADVTASQLATSNGYTQNNEILTTTSVSEDDTNDRGQFTCADVTWTAENGSIGPTGAAVLYDETTADATVIGAIDFGTDFTIPSESGLQIQNIVINHF